MRLTAFFLLACSMHVSATGFSQITLKAKAVPLQRVLADMQKQSGFDFVYTAEIIAAGGTVTVNLDNASVEDALRAVLKNKNLSYSIEGKIVAIVPSAPVKPALVLETPPINVKGRIVNENGEPVVASITIKGTNRGVTSNANGEFELNNIEDDAELIITSASTEPVTIKINKQTLLNISVRSAVNDLDAVVVNKGYYTEKQRFSTGNVAKVEAKDIEKQPIANPLLALQGRTAGVQITQETGMPGGGVSLLIRGRNSLLDNGNNPLYIIDGVPYPSRTIASEVGNTTDRGGSPLSAINPSDIENIEILKDADATAIYGSRGANGVVLITTKRGRAGKVAYDLNVYKGLGQVTRKMDLLNTQQYVEMRNEAFKNDGVTKTLVNAPDLLLWDTTRYTDWQKVLIGGTANTTNLQGNVSGGDKNTQFLVALGYFRETPVFPGSFNYNKATGRFNLNHRSSNERFWLSLNMNYSVENNLLPAGDPVTSVLLSPNAPEIYTSEGKLNWENNTFNNPFGALLQTTEKNTNTLVGQLQLNYLIVRGLTLKANIGYSSMFKDEITKYPIPSYNPSFQVTTGTSNFLNGNLKTWITEPQLEYVTTIGKGKFSALAGTTFQQNQDNYSMIYASGFLDDNSLETISAGSSFFHASNFSNYKYNAVYGRVNYTYDEKYMINLTGRRDGSTRFSTGNQFANFGAIGLGWIFTEEKGIMNNLRFLSFGKLRSSYGIVGNDQIPDYGFLSTYTYTGVTYQGISTLSPSRLANPNYQWETTKKFEVGLDVRFVHDRIAFSGSYYFNRSSNQLVGLPVPAHTGFSTLQYNLPATVQNSGAEIIINTVNLQSKNLTWFTSLNLTVPKNKLVAYPNIEGSPYANQYVVGKSLYIRKKYKYLNVDPATGLYVFEDINDDNSVTWPADLQGIKEIAQKFYGGLQNTFTYKTFQLDIVLQFVKQTATNFLSNSNAFAGARFNQPTYVLNRWQKEGDITNVQRYSRTFGGATYGSFSDAQYYGDITISDASYIRLKNIALSYNIPSAILDRVKIQRARLYIQAQNLFTITNYLGWDPESRLNLPPLRMISTGIQVTL